MPAKHSRHIALTAPLAEYVAGQVKQGRYASASEVVRAAVRLLMAQDAGRGGASAQVQVPEPESTPRPGRKGWSHGRG